MQALAIPTGQLFSAVIPSVGEQIFFKLQDRIICMTKPDKSWVNRAGCDAMTGVIIENYKPLKGIYG